MSRHLVPLLVGAAVLIAGCGTAARGTVAADSPDSASRGTPSTPPTAAPWPSYDVADYTYTLRTSCFCADRGVPVTVTVGDGKVTRATYARPGRGHTAGDRAPDWLQVTIDDVIDAANTPQRRLRAREVAPGPGLPDVGVGGPGREHRRRGDRVHDRGRDPGLTGPGRAPTRTSRRSSRARRPRSPRSASFPAPGSAGAPGSSATAPPTRGRGSAR